MILFLILLLLIMSSTNTIYVSGSNLSQHRYWASETNDVIYWSLLVQTNLAMLNQKKVELGEYRTVSKQHNPWPPLTLISADMPSIPWTFRNLFTSKGAHLRRDRTHTEHTVHAKSARLFGLGTCYQYHNFFMIIQVRITC